MTGKKQSRYALIDDSPGGVCRVIDIQNTMPTILFQSKKQALKFINHLQHQEQKTYKKQEHIVRLEHKINRMRKQIHKLEYLYHYRTVEIEREYNKKNQKIRDDL